MRLIINGGSELQGCPKDWDEAKEWIKKANEDKGENIEPEWSFDCGFKLDFDGPILRVSSRFYPPKEFYGPTWDGTVSVYIFNEKIEEKKFDYETFNDLKQAVELYINEIKDKAKSLFNNY